MFVPADMLSGYPSKLGIKINLPVEGQSCGGIQKLCILTLRDPRSQLFDCTCKLNVLSPMLQNYKNICSVSLQKLQGSYYYRIVTLV